ncbi:two-component regulator propeller domain-containing protein [Muriicola sp. E247]|uniref:ligand-binding sensor domain-containing protein n=1 Tax=Muriicola sp. E247 TaxID=3242730 RepID=UPI00352599C5
MIIGALIALSSCNGINNDKVSKKSERQILKGKSVSDLSPSIWTIYQDKKSNYWFGSKDKGVFYYDGQELINFTKDDGLIGNQIRRIQEDTFGNIYFETTEGISQFDGKSFNSLSIDKNLSGTNQWKLQPDDLWFSSGYQGKGPLRYDGNRLYSYEFPKSPHEDDFIEKYPNTSHSPYGIYAIYKDRKGHIWFGTSDMGIYRFDGKIISYLYEKELTETPNGGAFGIRSIAEDRKGHIWISNSDYKYEIKHEIILDKDLGQITYNRLPGIKNKEKETQYFLSMVMDNSHNLWMMTFDNGVWKNNGKDLTHYPIKDGTNDVKLSSMYKDNQGVIWLGTQGSGVLKFNKNSFEKVEFKKTSVR